MPPWHVDREAESTPGLMPRPQALGTALRPPPVEPVAGHGAAPVTQGPMEGLVTAPAGAASCPFPPPPKLSREAWAWLQAGWEPQDLETDGRSTPSTL